MYTEIKDVILYNKIKNKLNDYEIDQIYFNDWITKYFMNKLDSKSIEWFYNKIYRQSDFIKTTSKIIKEGWTDENTLLFNDLINNYLEKYPKRFWFYEKYEPEYDENYLWLLLDKTYPILTYIKK